MNFDILSKETPIHSSLLIEASAGTGKTFAIEHLYVRLLVEKRWRPREILVMTFTKAATYELKERIRRRIDQTIRYLEGETGAPEYMEGWDPQAAKRSLRHALIEWEEGEITTLHSFCEKRLKEGELDGGEFVLLEPTDLVKIIRDFFRTRLKEPSYSPAQLEKVLKRYPDLEETLLYRANRRLETPPLPSHEELLEQFLNASIRQIEPDKVMEDFNQQAPFYKEMMNRQGEMKKEVKEKIETFSHLLKEKTKGTFEWLIREGIPFSPDQRKKNYQEPASLHYPGLIEELHREWGAIVETASSPSFLITRMGADIEQLVKKMEQKEEKKRFDDLLHGVLKRLDDPLFRKPIQERFQAAIIDEFQDTDPIQWTILETLFGNKHLYLVGDPKQAIYAFRQADIYTYLKAEQSLPLESKKELSVNFRSQPFLIEALNDFFSTPSLLPLPRLKKALSVPPVQAGKKETWGCLSTKKALHVWIGESEEAFFDQTVQEIHRLKQEWIHFHQWALLVKDRHQAKRVADKLSQAGIPFKLQRDLLLTETGVKEALVDLLDALLHLHDMNRLKKAWGGVLWGLTAEELKNIETSLLSLMEEMEALQKLWLEKGWSHLFEKLGKKFGKRLLKEGRESFYLAWMQLGEWMVEEKLSTPDQCLKFLRRLDSLPEDKLKVKSDPFAEAVHIVTIHSSKGLEYDFVVPLGLIAASKEKVEGAVIDQLFIPFSSPSDPRALQEIEELQAEKMRHLYVAMTRACLRVYLPALFPEKKGSPLSLWMERSEIKGEEEFTLWIEKRKEKISYEKVEKNAAVFSFDEKVFSLTPPPPLPAAPSPFIIKSFSALTAGNKGGSPLSFISKEEKTPHTLPAGKEVGIILHQLLEKWPYEQEETFYFVQERLKGTFLEEWALVVHAMIEKALKNSFPFSLKEVNPSYMLHEVEFLHQGAPWMKGVIDLVFYHQGLYYIVDWKTNWLGEGEESYSPIQLKKAMEEHQYFLQASIYKEALKKYLAHFDSRPFEAIYGGAAYIFLRGGVFLC